MRARGGDTGEWTTSDEKLSYKAAGVDIDAGDRMVDLIQTAVRRTHDPRVLSRGDTFAGLFSLDYSQRLLKRNYREPVLVSGTDGVGSKLLLALEAEAAARGRGPLRADAGRGPLRCVGDLGIDLVAMSVNDVLTMGAEPLFFLDYIACHRLEPERMAELVEGVARGCGEAGCSLLGGETAEMPDLYRAEHFDLAGFCVGVVEKRRIIDGKYVEPGDAVLGLASSGVHSNGFALVRRLLGRLPQDGSLPAELREGESPVASAPRGRREDEVPVASAPRGRREDESLVASAPRGRREDESPVASAPRGRRQSEAPADPPITTRGELIERLLRPTRIYAKPVLQVLKRYRRKRVVRAMAHITGGGLEGNLPRVLPRDCDACVSRESWPVPAVFRVLQRLGVDEEEMYRVFNMGIGYVLVVRPAFAESVAGHLGKLGETVYRIGTIRRGGGGFAWR